MTAARALLRCFSYLFHGLLSLFLLAISSVAWFSGSNILTLEMLPWQGKALSYWLLGSSLAGLISVLLALKGALRVLFFVWSLVVLVMLLRGYFFSSYRFASGSFTTAACLVVGACIAALGAWRQWRPERSKR